MTFRSPKRVWQLTHAFHPCVQYVFLDLLDQLMFGMLTEPTNKPDGFFFREVIDHLFDSGNDGGLDLVAINIQRGRDHGLPGSSRIWNFTHCLTVRSHSVFHCMEFSLGYNQYRQTCGVGSGIASSFDDFSDVISRREVRKLKRTYQHVDDVDLYVGGFLEKPDGDSILGPTFKCMVGDVFARCW